MLANSGDPDQTPRSAASGRGLHCLSMSHKKDARLIWVKFCCHFHLISYLPTCSVQNIDNLAYRCS